MERLLFQWFRKRHSIVATYNLLYNASLLVQARVGVALCLNGIIETSYDASPLAFLPFDHPNTDSLQLIWKKQNKPSPATKALLQELREKRLEQE